MPIIEDIIKAGYNYQGDVIVDTTPKRDVYHTRIYDKDIGSHDAHLTTEEEINNFLQTNGYYQIPSSEGNYLFNPLWIYRLVSPDWDHFRKWLITWYAYQELKVDEKSKEQAVYMNILHILGMRDLDTTEMRKVADQYAKTACNDGEDLKIINMYDDLSALITSYRTGGL